MSLILSGKRQLSMRLAQQFAKFLRVPTEEVLRAAGMQLEPRANEFAEFDLTGTVDDQRRIIPVTPLSTVFGHRDLTPDTVAVRAHTTGSAEDHIDGWVFFFRDSIEVDPNLVAKLCIAEDESGTRRLGNLRRGYGDEKTWNLDCGRKVIEDLKIVSATPIIWIQP